MEDNSDFNALEVDTTTMDVCELQEDQEPSAAPDIPGRDKIKGWLNKSLRVEMSDGRVLIGVFLCTDRDANIILGSCSEYLPEESDGETPTYSEEPRMLGLIMIPGQHIVSVCIDSVEMDEQSPSEPTV